MATDFFADLNLEEEQYDKLMDVLETSGVDIMQLPEEEESDDEFIPEDDMMEEVDITSMRGEEVVELLYRKPLYIKVKEEE